MNWHALITGVSRVVDLFGVHRDPEVAHILEQTDSEAIASDWQAVGDDLRKPVEER